LHLDFQRLFSEKFAKNKLEPNQEERQIFNLYNWTYFLGESFIMSSDANTEINVTKLRIESLKANRNFFTVLFTVESAILAIAIQFFARLSFEFAVSAFLLFSSIFLILFGVFMLTDSIHFYSKFLEYQYMWKDKVHGVAYEGKTKEKKAIGAFKRALESDDVGYYFLKLSLLSFTYFLVSLVLNVYELGIIVRIIVFFSAGLLVTFVAIYSYKTTHRKRFLESLIAFFRRKPVFKDQNDQ